MAELRDFLLLLAQGHFGKELFLLQFPQVNQLGLGDGHLIGQVGKLPRVIRALKAGIAVLEFPEIQSGEIQGNFGIIDVLLIPQLLNLQVIL